MLSLTNQKRAASNPADEKQSYLPNRIQDFFQHCISTTVVCTAVMKK